VADPVSDLRERVADYLRAHHTMTVATVGPLPAAEAGAGGSPAGGAADSGPAVPNAASVFYAVDDDLRLIFLSKSESTHGLHIGQVAPVAVTVTEQYDDWEDIRGVQLWGVAKRVTGPAKVAAMAAYLRRFPFVDDLLEQPRLAAAMRGISVYRVEPHRVAFTDNTTGVFGREILDLKG
jgi:uncharacterized protein YhbP (UPF0306 family)